MSNTDEQADTEAPARPPEGDGFGLLWGSVAAIVAAAVVYFLAVRHFIPDPNSRGTFGDAFGALTSVFSGLAFAGLLYTINLQRRELRLQREELAATREEMKAARAEQRKSADAQADLVRQQRLSTTVHGLSAILQGRYQVTDAAVAGGRNLDPKDWIRQFVTPQEKMLVRRLEELEGRNLGIQYLE